MIVARMVARIVARIVGTGQDSGNDSGQDGGQDSGQDSGHVETLAWSTKNDQPLCAATLLPSWPCGSSHPNRADRPILS